MSAWWALAGVLAALALVGHYRGLWLAMAVVCRSVLWLRVRRRAAAGGPLLLVGPALNPFGWLIVLAASPRRVRFLVLAGWAQVGLVGWLLRRAGAVVPDGADSAAVRRAVSRAADALRRGEAVCVFAEAIRTSDGDDWPYSRVFDALAPQTVVPVVLLQPRGSLFAMHGGTHLLRSPLPLLSPTEVTFGTPMTAPTAGDARQALQELSAETAIDRTARCVPVHRRFVRMAARHPFRSCWIDSTAPGQDLTYAKAYVGASCLAALLKPMLGSARMVAIWLPTGRGGAMANIALTFLGKVAVNLNYTTSPDAVRSCLRQCECTHVLTARRFTARLPIDPGPGVEVIYLDDLIPKVSSFDKLMTMLGLLLLPGWVSEYWVRRLGGHGPDDVATVIFSSGSTGEPKGIVLTHANVACNLESMTQAADLDGRDRLLCVLPLFHSFGYTVTLWGPLQVGASAVFHPDPRQAKEIGELCRQHAATVYLSTATFLRFCLRKCDPADFKTLRLIICGAEKLPPALAAEVGGRFGLVPLEGYGCTELSPVVSTNMADRAAGGLTEVLNRTGSVGSPVPGVAARVADPDTLAPLPVGTEGVLLITGANVMAGYLNRPDLTAQVIHDGWYVTGDMARLDAEGYVTITGRLSRFAKIGGEMVPLERVEEALHEALGVSERVCAVACVPDEARGERVVVLYVEASLIEWKKGVRTWLEELSGQGLPNLWTPGERDFYAVAELPVLGTGKLNLQKVKELALTLARR